MSVGAAPDMVTIPLTGALGRGKVALIDASDAALVSGETWALKQSSTRLYVRSGRKVLLHRLIMDPPAGLFVDHINGDTLDNRRANLRVVTGGQNAKNRTGQKTGNGRPPSSQFKGVKLCMTHRDSPPWRASITVNGRCLSLGRYWTEVEAAKAYDKAAHELHGIYARPNFVTALD